MAELPDGAGQRTDPAAPAGTAAAPDQDVVDLLLRQHAEIEELFGRVLATGGAERRGHFERLVRLLAVHETAEEEVVHPLARRRIEGGEEVVDARLAEEREAKQLLAGMEEQDVDSAEFDARLLVLRREVLEHATREERYEFPYLRAHLDPRTGRRLLAAVRAAERFAPTHPHPGVESAAANLLAGPALAIMDRIRDAMRDQLRRSDQPQ